MSSPALNTGDQPGIITNSSPATRTTSMDKNRYGHNTPHIWPNDNSNMGVEARYWEEQRDAVDNDRTSTLRDPCNHDGAFIWTGAPRLSKRRNSAAVRMAQATADCSTLEAKSRSYPPGNHLWTKPKIRKRAAGAISICPPRSPVHATEWWQRPPSPMHWHMRPLWDGLMMVNRRESELSQVSGVELQQHAADEMAEQPGKLSSSGSESTGQ
ncbi:unnamed protein product, partial [Sphacelaria rigidula]